MEPLFGQPDTDVDEVIPTVAGDYSFHIVGTINGVALDAIVTWQYQ